MPKRRGGSSPLPRTRSLSSVGRACGLHPQGRGFETLSDHNIEHFKIVSLKNSLHFFQEDATMT